MKKTDKMFMNAEKFCFVILSIFFLDRFFDIKEIFKTYENNWIIGLKIFYDSTKEKSPSSKMNLFCSSDFSYATIICLLSCHDKQIRSEL